MKHEPKLIRINGPVVFADRMGNASLGNQVEVGREHLTGEIIALENDIATIQVYEDTIGIKPGEPVRVLDEPVSVLLGPGILKSIYDGIQRPLDKLKDKSGTFIKRGLNVPAIDLDREWDFRPVVKTGQTVTPLAILGEIPETELVVHKVMVPHKYSGHLSWIAAPGKHKVTDVIARVVTEAGEKEITIMRKWPIRRPRPIIKRLLPNVPVITGQRVIDFLFPVARGGAAAIPGGFGTGKTVTQHQLAKWCDVDIIVYIGCGERGNEMTQVLEEFPALKDPHSQKPIMERTTLIANTSNMPVTAREASIYTGVTIAEYYRDMGYHVAIMADSTSRWAEALREISGRLEQMPAEEGYPAYLASRIGEFYERAGRSEITDHDGTKREGSVTIIGAVSPPGGDFSEPVVTHTRRFVRTFWGLDRDLASARHFPSIHWNSSYSEYDVSRWWEKNSSLSWSDLHRKAMEILKEDDRLQNIVKLIGPDALPDRQRITLEVARMIKEGFLQQSAFSEVDSYCSPEKQLAMIDIILCFYEKAGKLSATGVPASEIMQLPVVDKIFRMKEEIGNDEQAKFTEFKKIVEESFME
ncbi:MAG: V-type ATP synthase subunit A [Candidatus Marinimicrobia bacterium]|nr:V-type ATP synthase subunit A [Candidatus Neomarinimicrobiota bacterium]